MPFVKICINTKLLSTGGSTVNIIIDRPFPGTGTYLTGGKALEIPVRIYCGFLTVYSYSTAKAKVYSSATRPVVTQLTQHSAGFI